MKINLLHEFFNSRSDASSLEASEQEQLEHEFENWLESREQTFDEIVEPLIRYLAENHSPHTIALVENDKAMIFGAARCFICEDYICD